MDFKNIPILHVDGSLSEYLDKNGVLNKIGGIGGYLVLNGKIIDQFNKTLCDCPNLEHHEDYAIIEGLKWVKSKKIKSIKVKTDSLSSINLFNNQKKNVSKEDKFFLLQYMLLEFYFDILEISYQSRNKEDLSHKLSRNYLKKIPTNLIKLDYNNKKLNNIKINESNVLDKVFLQNKLLDSLKEIICNIK